jgi:hypothetical protein
MPARLKLLDARIQILAFEVDDSARRPSLDVHARAARKSPRPGEASESRVAVNALDLAGVLTAGGPPVAHTASDRPDL